jgi:hypothetical protein
MFYVDFVPGIITSGSATYVTR